MCRALGVEGPFPGVDVGALGGDVEGHGVNGEREEKGSSRATSVSRTRLRQPPTPCEPEEDRLFLCNVSTAIPPPIRKPNTLGAPSGRSPGAEVPRRKSKGRPSGIDAGPWPFTRGCV
jgi:hypothetical protein